MCRRRPNGKVKKSVSRTEEPVFVVFFQQPKFFCLVSETRDFKLTFFDRRTNDARRL